MVQAKRRIFIITMVLTSTFFGLFPEQVHADAWGSNFGSILLDQMLNNIKRQIEGAILGTMKMVAIQTLNSKVGQLIGGVTGQPLFITNFGEFLYQNPRQNTDLFMNDFFSITTRGRGSSVNYISTDSESSSYSEYLTSVGRRGTVDRDTFGHNTLDDFGGITAFQNGNPRAFNAFFANPLNNPTGYLLVASNVYANELEKQQKIAEIKALSPGTLPSESNGTITAPATAITATLNNAADLPNKMIASATNPGELLSGVVSSMANRLVSNMIQKGVGEIQSKISREVRDFDNQISRSINFQMKEVGPAIQFIGTAKETGKIKIRTPAPPAALP
ncbi:MAG: hypothetical protein AUK58_00455 [Candidatus Moranbacteria bacterium CG2_30_41_165]|nr:MAG: hypothetical protein AUK58_00455 [Candidatus Moranbacteria bacterium CG2_30_41_165]PIV86332.1 MAG: hypothetical protein COW50_01985 [Candidatus Moranbacteria bacterium CG17_big_fil_post_rev_8_21_14_2_50_41_107]PJC00004.1 MAG: hypothetical protein CO075_02975 [Candidatus Moranbacteria bacterium CG_4_9_14_0_8_um_filter_41_43]